MDIAITALPNDITLFLTRIGQRSSHCPTILPLQFRLQFPVTGIFPITGPAILPHNQMNMISESIFPLTGNLPISQWVHAL